jgi:hypothetical protein
MRNSRNNFVALNLNLRSHWWGGGAHREKGTGNREREELKSRIADSEFRTESESRIPAHEVGGGEDVLEEVFLPNKAKRLLWLSQFTFGFGKTKPNLRLKSAPKRSQLPGGLWSAGRGSEDPICLIE